MSVSSLFEYIKQDNELQCNLALAKFLGITIGKLIHYQRGIEVMSEEVLQTIMVKTDLTREEITLELLRVP